MRHHEDQSISPSSRTPARPPHGSDGSGQRPTPPNAFSPSYLADVRGRDESLTASEAELAGPWKLEPLPGHPGAVAVLRECESLDEGDEPEAVFVEEETGTVCAAILPAVEREPLYHLEEEADPDGLIPGGFPVITIHGEQGPRVRGWLRRYRPEIVRALATVESLNRAPAALAVVLEAGGGGALERIGRELAARQQRD
jgi:hypothetical protein